MTGLMAHQDCRLGTLEQLRATDVHCPEPDGRWRPLPHGQVRDTIVAEVESKGLIVTNERWALSDATKRRAGFQPQPGMYDGDGARVFGLLNIGNTDGGSERGWMIGIRSSYDKTIALGIAAGVNVFVCDNMSLLGDQVTFRKHTTNIDVVAEAQKALSIIEDHGAAFSQWFDRLQERQILDASFDQMICDGLRAGIMPGNTATDCLRAWYDCEAPKSDQSGLSARLENGVYDARTAYTAHELWTDIVGKRQNITAAGNALLSSHKAWNAIVAERAAVSLN